MFELQKRPIGLDDMADVRHLHASAVKIGGAAYHTPAEINAYNERINSTDYIRDCLNCSLYGLWHQHLLVGTAGWCPSNDNRTTARLRKIFIHNYYIGMGLGKFMLEHTENRAKEAGFQEFSIRATAMSAGFFRHLGYETSSHGALLLSQSEDIPVTYLRKARQTPTMERRSAAERLFQESPQSSPQKATRQALLKQLG